MTRAPGYLYENFKAREGDGGSGMGEGGKLWRKHNAMRDVQARSERNVHVAGESSTIGGVWRSVETCEGGLTSVFTRG